jgi:hypothetical protein
MSFIKETRYKCDHCGNKSPVVESVEQAEKMGWKIDYSLLEAAQPLPSGWDKQQRYLDLIKHFCIPAHREAWLAQQGVKA